jgi:hypothetical protein
MVELHRDKRRLELRVTCRNDVGCVGLVRSIRIDDLEAIIGER